MAHITFIHGISNKPSADVLLEQWRLALAANGGIDLERLGVTSSMVYWADVLYPETQNDAESVSPTACDEPAIIAQLATATMDPEEARFLAGLSGKFSIAAIKSLAALPSTDEARPSEERIPLPWVMKEPLMAVLLRDVHHYLFNKRFSPREGEEYWVRDELRRRFVNQATLAGSKPGPHVVVAHSMGTVIAYDCLLRVSQCAAVDALLTIGSPLGLDEIQDKMQPEWTRSHGFPATKIGTWINVFDLLDPVAGFDPVLANDFRRNGRRAVVDISEANWGWWRHDIAKYLSGSQLRAVLRSLLRLPARSPESADVSPSELMSRQRNEATAARESSKGRSLVADVESWLQNLQSAVGTAEKSRRGKRPSRIESFEEATQQLTDDPAERASFLSELREAFAEIKAEADQQGECVMSSPRHRLAALVQSELAVFRKRADDSTMDEIPFDNRDTKDILRRLFEQTSHVRKHSQRRPASAIPDKFPDRARIFLVSDFGTGLYGAPVIAATAAEQGNFDLMMHLGDIYYSGTEKEVRDNFLSIWPTSAGEISRTLNGNHDMYSGGYGYFDVALPAFEQRSSYFAFQNKHWLLAALDTAYQDNDIDTRQRQWLNDVLSSAGNRRLLLFSHHPLFSDFKDQGKKIGQRLIDLLDRRRVTAWYWGHEHHAVVFDPHSSYELRARCLGNGGMPYKRKDLKDFYAEDMVGEFAWRRGLGLLTPPSLYLDGPNKYVTSDPKKYGPHGFMTIEFDGSQATEAIFTADGIEVFQGQLP